MRNSPLVLIGALLALSTVAVGDPQQQQQGQKPQAPATAKPTAASAEEAPIREAFQAFAKAYGARDVEAIVGLFTEDATAVDPSGNDSKGKAAIGEMYAGSFQEVGGLKLESEVGEIKFLTPDVARIEGRSKVSTDNGDANEYNRFSALSVRKDGKWRVAELREYPAAVTDVTPYERLKELEWMVGEWVDESDNNKVSSHVHWAENKSYLIRTYSVEIQGEKASSGTMFVGWSPQSGQIKSWVFDSEGGHGEGLWTRTSENQWIVKAQGVLRDGRPTSATQVHNVLNQHSVKTSSIDRIIGGQVAPDILDLVMVRKPPKPESTPAAK